MKVIYIAGSSCTGKTTLSAHLASKLNAFLIPTDIVKYTIRYQKKDKKDIIFSNTFSAYKGYEDYSPEAVFKYATKHSYEIIKILGGIVHYFSSIYEYLVVEGAHLVPELLIANKLVDDSSYYFLLNLSRKKHVARLKERSFKEKTHEDFKEIFDFQDKLIESRKKINQSYKINSSTEETAMRDILQKIYDD